VDGPTANCVAAAFERLRMLRERATTAGAGSRRNPRPPSSLVYGYKNRGRQTYVLTISVAGPTSRAAPFSSRAWMIRATGFMDSSTSSWIGYW
jgi:hypothetical protein